MTGAKVSVVALGPWQQGQRDDVMVRNHVTGMAPTFFSYGHWAAVGPTGWALYLDGEKMAFDSETHGAGRTACDGAAKAHRVLLLSAEPTVFADFDDDAPGCDATLEDGRVVRLLIDMDNNGHLLIDREML